MIDDHKLKTPEDCDCWERYVKSDSDLAPPHCPVCVGGLAVCLICGAAEAELDGPCVKVKKVILVSKSYFRECKCLNTKET